MKCNLVARMSLARVSACCAIMVLSLAAVSSGVWTAKAPMTNDRVYLIAGAIDGLIYAFGGSGSAGKTASEVYNPVTDTWSSLPPAPSGRVYASAGVIDGKVYVAGGCINSDCLAGLTGLLEVYDPLTNTWTTRAPMPSSRNNAAAGVIDGKLYVAGGMLHCGPCTPLTTLEAYDPVNDTWTTKAAMPTARTFTTGAALDGKFYVIGGNAVAETGVVEVYDPATDSWSTGSAMPTPRQLLAAQVLNGKIYVVGGQTSASNALNVVETYDPATDTWISEAPMLTARNGMAAAVVGNTLYAIGGADITGNILASVEALISGANAITLDVNPGSTANPVNLRSKGVIPVAVLTTTDFDATLVDVATACFGDAESPGERDCSEAHGRGHPEDVDADGDVDIVLHFETQQTGIDPGDTQACLDASTTDGTAIEDCDSITVR